MSQSPDSTFTRFTTEPVEKLIPRLAIPCIISMMVTAIYNMADTYFVGQLGDNAASGAVGIIFSLMALIQAIGMFYGQGSGNYISRELGKQNVEGAQIMASTALYSSLLLGCAVCAVGLLCSEWLVYFMGATDTIAPHAQGYMFYILLGAPFMMGSFVLNNQLRFQGRAPLAMVGIAAGSVLNIALDPIFIFYLGMGVSGAALATCLSQFISFSLLYYISTRPGQLGLSLAKFHPCVQQLRLVANGGLPSLGRQGLASVAVICLNQAAGPYGDAAIAAISVVSRIVTFGFSAMLGFGQGFQPVCGYNFGAGLYSRVRKGFWFCVRTSFFFLLLFGALGFYFAPDLIAVFRDDPEVIAYGTLSLRLQCISFVCFCWIVSSNMMLQTIGRTVPATIVAIGRQGLFLIPAIFILTSLLGLTGVLIAQGVADFATFLLCIPLQFKVLKELSVPDGTPLSH